MSIEALVGKCRREVEMYRAILNDPRTPSVSRWCLRAAVAYLVSPIDLIPDFIPAIGQLDDVVIVVTLVAIARHFVPAVVLADHAKRRELPGGPGDPSAETPESP